MIQSIISGVLQGILEWLPISSQGNLALLMMKGLGYSPQKALSLSIFLHGGTLLAAVIYFRREIKDIVLASRKQGLRLFGNQESIESKTLSFLLISTLATALIGYPLLSFLTLPIFSEKVFSAIIGASLIFTGLFQKFIKPKGLKTKKSLSFKDSILLGAAQGLAVIPGISRSGITTSSFLLRGYEIKEALKLSFLMSIPAVIGAQLGLLLTNTLPEISISEGLAGLSFAFFFGTITIHSLLKLTEKIRFWLFCLILGLCTLAPLLF